MEPTGETQLAERGEAATFEAREAMVLDFAALRGELGAFREQLDVGRRLAWLIASPAVLGGLLLIFVVVTWGFLDVVEPSGTTSTALVVGALLVLVPARMAALRQDRTAADHAQGVYDAVKSILESPK